MKKGRFVDEAHVLKYRSDAEVYQSHVSKHKKRNRDLEIVFDPDKHRDYVTGFRKRKQQRRKEAVKSLEKLQREQRLEERAERREAKKEQFNLHDVSDGDQHDAATNHENVRVFETDTMKSTVKVTPISHESDDEHASKVDGRQWKGFTAEESGEMVGGRKAGKKGKPMTKTSLEVLSNTRMKIQGIKKRKQFGSKNCKTKGGACGPGDKKKGASDKVVSVKKGPAGKRRKKR